MHSYKTGFLWSLVNLYLSTSGKIWDTLVFPGLKPSSKQTSLANLHLTFCKSDWANRALPHPTPESFRCRIPCSPSCVCPGTLPLPGDLSKLSVHTWGQSTPVAPPASIRGTGQSRHLICQQAVICWPPDHAGTPQLRVACLSAERRWGHYGGVSLLKPPSLCPCLPAGRDREGWLRAHRSGSCPVRPGDTGRGGDTRAGPGAGQGMRGAAARALRGPRLGAGAAAATRAQPPAPPRPRVGNERRERSLQLLVEGLEFRLR